MFGDVAASLSTFPVAIAFGRPATATAAATPNPFSPTISFDIDLDWKVLLLLHGFACATSAGLDRLSLLATIYLRFVFLLTAVCSARRICGCRQLSVVRSGVGHAVGEAARCSRSELATRRRGWRVVAAGLFASGAALR